MQHKMRGPKTTRYSSDGTLLIFEVSDYDLLEEYEQALLELNDKYYALLRKRNGIYATNQDKYVQTEEELNAYDHRTMENRFWHKRVREIVW